MKLRKQRFSWWVDEGGSHDPTASFHDRYRAIDRRKPEGELSIRPKLPIASAQRATERVVDVSCWAFDAQLQEVFVRHLRGRERDWDTQSDQRQHDFVQCPCAGGRIGPRRRK